MNVSAIRTKDYKKMSTWAIYENKANSKPIKANFPAPQIAKFAQFHTDKPLNNNFDAAFVSAKMAQYMINPNLQNSGRKKLNPLKCKGLNNQARPLSSTGTFFAHSILRNFLYTDDSN
jgi:hypothetical protein